MPHALIVGAGIIGLSTASELLDRGWDVTVYDPDPASGASRAAAGMLAPAAEVVWGQHPLYPLMIESARRYPDYVARVEAETGRAVGYLATGTLVVGADPADRATLDDLAALQTGLGLPAERITASAARRLEPALAPTISGGVLLPEDHQIDPRAVMAALLVRLGDRVVRARVTGVVTGGDGATRGVRLDDGSVARADEVVACAGLGALDGLEPLPLRPVHGDVLRLRLPEAALPLATRTIRGLVRGRPAYVVPRADGTVVVGASSREDGDPEVSTEFVHRLLEDVRRLVPGILDSRLLETMARARPGTPDDLPVIGRQDDGLVVSTGYFRHGILLTPLGAQLTADLVTGRTVDPDLARAVDPRRFDAAPSTPVATASSTPAGTTAASDPTPHPSSSSPGRSPIMTDDTITITVNGAREALPEPARLIDIVAGHIGRRLNADGTPEDGGRLGVATAVDGAVVPRGRWADHRVGAGAEIDIVTAAQGG